MITRRGFAVVAGGGMLAACGEGNTIKLPGGTIVTIPTPAAWKFHSNTSGTTLQKTASGFQFAFPVSPGYVNYCMYNIDSSIAGEMVCTFQITGANPVFNAKLRDQTSDDPPPGFKLWFQRKGDDYSASLGGGSYRWWSTDRRVLADDLGTVRGIQVPLTPDRWTNVAGRSGTADPAGFSAALQECGSVGLTFGGGFFAGHGVNLLSGSAVFDMKQFHPA